MLVVKMLRHSLRGGFEIQFATRHRLKRCFGSGLFFELVNPVDVRFSYSLEEEVLKFDIALRRSFESLATDHVQNHSVNPKNRQICFFN